MSIDYARQDRTAMHNSDFPPGMTKEEFDQMMAEGYNQAVADEAYDLDEVFDELEVN